MKASLDTNVIIHFYRANLQNILFDFFQDGIVIYKQLREVELEHHAKELLEYIDSDIQLGKIELYSDEKLKEKSVLKMFQLKVRENRLLYGAGDLGEVYAISLAQTLGTYSLVTDDTKQGGPYMSLLQFEDEIMPFNFADVIILRYLLGMADEVQTVKDFDMLNSASNLNWSFKSQIAKFIKRFFKEPYRNEDRDWMQSLITENKIRIKSKFIALNNVLKNIT